MFRSLAIVAATALAAPAFADGHAVDLTPTGQPAMCKEEAAYSVTKMLLKPCQK